MFQRYRLEPIGEDEYTITLFLSPALEEFAKELGEEERDERMGLESTVKRFLRERFPDLKVTGAKVMMGTMLLTSLTFGGSAMTAGAAGAETLPFTDIRGSYAQEQIAALAREGVLTGMPDGTFQPADTMTRDEFAVLLARMMKLELGEAAPLAGVEPWAAPYVSAVVRAGYMQGVSEHEFGGEQSITREQIATIFVRSLGMEQQARLFGKAATFSDADAVSDWARSSVAFAQHIGFIQGSPDENGTFRFNPQDAAQRQEVAVMAHKYFYNKDKYVEHANDMIQTSAPRLQPVFGFVNSINQEAFTLDGTGKAGEQVTLTVGDGTKTVTSTATVGANGLYRAIVDAEPLKDGPLTVTAKLKDDRGGTRKVDLELTKDTAAQVPVIANRNNIDDTNQLSYVVEGTGEANAHVIVYAVDQQGNRVQAEGTVDAEGRFLVPIDARPLVNGPVKLSTGLIDRAGNTSPIQESSVTVDKTVRAGLPAPNVSTEGPLTRENAPRYHVWGTFEGTGLTLHTGLENEQGEDLVPYRSKLTGGNEFDYHMDMSGLPKGTYNLTHFLTSNDGKTSPVTRVPVEKNF